MADDLIIELNNTSSISISQDTCFEDFVAQFQTSCSKLLSIVNGKQLHYYDKKAELPIGLKFEYKRKNKGRTSYYFRDVANNTYCVFGREVALLFYNRLDEVDPILSSLSGISEAPSLSGVSGVSGISEVPNFPNLTNKSNTVNRLDKPKTLPPKSKAIVISINDNKIRPNVTNATTRIIKSKCPTEVLIIDCGQKHSFPYINFNIEISNHEHPI